MINNKTVGEDDIHKLSYYPTLMAAYTCLVSSHLELRLGIVASTELHVMLWYLDALLSQVKDYEMRYSTCKKSCFGCQK